MVHMGGAFKDSLRWFRLPAGSVAAERCHRGLGYALLLYLTLIVAVVTLTPFAFAAPTTLRFTLRGNIHDVLANIVLFVPLGFFFQVTHKKVGWKPLVGALCFGLAVSSLVEAGQLFLPLRYSSLIDIITNTMGAGVGAAMAGYHQLLVNKGRMPERFGFGLPLISSAYLLIPLLWLGGISAGREIWRLGLMLLVGVYGAGVIASVIVNRSGPRKRRPGPAVVGYVSGWFMIGAVPALTHFPFAVALVGLLVVAVAWLSCRMWEKPSSAERRFELPTVKSFLPVYLVYLLLLVLWPTTMPLGEWSQQGDFQLLNQAGRVLFVARFVEAIAAFTLLGFLLAEMSGRKIETGVRSLARVFLCSFGVAIVMTGLRNGFSLPWAIFVEAAVFTTASMYGAIIYRLQLAVVKSHGPMTRP